MVLQLGRRLATLQSAAAATGDGTAMDVKGLVEVAMQVLISNTATVTFEGTIDGTNWVAVQAKNIGTGAAASTLAASGIVVMPVGGLSFVRARISAFTSGTVTVYGAGLPVGAAGGLVTA